MDRQAVANELAKRKFFAAPVVDSDNHILGIIKAERLIQGVQEHVTTVTDVMGFMAFLGFAGLFQ